MNWPWKDIPAGNESPEDAALRVHDVAQAEAAGHDHHADQRQAQRDLVADHLRAGSQAAQQGILAVGGPSCQRNSVHAHGRHAQHYQQANVDVRDRQRSRDPKQRNRIPKGITAIEVSAKITAIIGAAIYSGLYTYGGVRSSFNRNLAPSASGCSNPNGPTRVGPSDSACGRPPCAPARRYKRRQ